MKPLTRAKKLLKEAEERGERLKVYVLNDIIYKFDDYKEPFGYIKDLLNYGCQSGMVSELIYYRDTAKFYDDFYDEIEELREELESDFGEPLKINGDLKNYFAWLAYEETAIKISNELNLDF